MVKSEAPKLNALALGTSPVPPFRLSAPPASPATNVAVPESVPSWALPEPSAKVRPPASSSFHHAIMSVHAPASQTCVGPHAVPLAANLSCGQVALAPSQLSARSQVRAAGRQVVVDGAIVQLTVQQLVPSQASPVSSTS